MCTDVSHGAPSGAMFAETLSLSLLDYVVERLAPQPMRVRGALSAGQKRKTATCPYVATTLYRWSHALTE
jgi:hypothetical protein